jgi:hypothetical protein
MQYTDTQLKPMHKDVWNLNLESKVFIEIVHWGIDREHESFRPLNNDKGVWNYYITLWESLMPEGSFEPLWLEDKQTKFSEQGKEHITHDYMQQPFADVDWHGGITFYKKEGQIKGHRGIKLGCDYCHIWDAERGYNYTIDDVVSDALHTAKQIKELYKL